MRDISTKVTGSSLTADEFNDIPSEIENAILSAGISLSAADLFQLGKSIAVYAARGDFYEDSGIADAYVLSAAGLLETPTTYSDGARFRFRPTNTSTGASTVNIAGIGVKNITDSGVNSFITDELSELVFNATSDEFELVKRNPTEGLNTDSLLHIQHQTASGVAGGDFTTGSWNTAPLNTVITNNVSGASLLSNQVTLPAGVYWFEANSGVGGIGNNQTKLRNITDVSDGFIGFTESTNSTSFTDGIINIGSSKVFELQVSGIATVAVTGFGIAASFGVSNIYRDVVIWKVA